MNLVSMSNVYELVNEIRSKRGETLIEFHQSSSSSNTYNSFCTVYATDVSLLNCWGLIELDRVINIFMIYSFFILFFFVINLQIFIEILI